MYCGYIVWGGNWQLILTEFILHEKCSFFVAFFIGSYNCTAQEIDKWQQYLQDSIYKADDNNYVYLYKTKGGIRQKLIRYSLKGGRYVIATVFGDTLADTKAVVSPNLFRIVYEHYYDLMKLPEYMHNKILKNSQFKRTFL